MGDFSGFAGNFVFIHAGSEILAGWVALFERHLDYGIIHVRFSNKKTRGSLTISNKRVCVVAPARLHMGFIDISGSTGRRFGSIGLTINELATRLQIHGSQEMTVEGPQADRARRYVRKFAESLDVSGNVHVAIESAIPEHAGLGSGTQLALAIGTALCQLNGLQINLSALARMADRGARSGIGIAAFDRGGFVIDGGSSNRSQLPPVIVRLNVPEDWRFILVFDKNHEGLHGDQEIQAFENLPAFPQQEAARLCQSILMQALPSLVEEDVQGFGRVITDLQRTVGDYFADAQGGRYTSLEVGRAVSWLGEHGGVALGQSSWGPTGFCAVDGKQRAEGLVQGARREFSDYPELSFLAVNARNRGAQVDLEPATTKMLGHKSERYAI